jgi:DNA invertase Pin-like site-specific DNA recombinase
MKIAIYARCSTLEQHVEGQLHELRAYASARGWTITREYVDHGVSGAKESRPALDELMRDARRRRFQAVLAWRLDRIGRSLRHLVTLADEWRALNVGLVSLGEGIDCTAPSGRMVFGVLASLAEFERERVRERTIAGVQRARRAGKVLGRPRSQQPTGATLADVAGLGVREAARVLGVSRSTAQRMPAASQMVEKTA